MLLVVPPAHTDIPLATATCNCNLMLSVLYYADHNGNHGRMMKCRLCGPKQAVGFGALAMSLRASFTSQKMLLMTVLCQGIGSAKE